MVQVFEMSGLEGKIVLITGASTGIGAGAAKLFAALKGPFTLRLSSSLLPYTVDPGCNVAFCP